MFHTFALYEFPDEARPRLFALLRDAAARRPLFRIAHAWEGEGRADATLELVAYEEGEESAERLGRCDTHGAWLAWTADTTG